MRFWPSSYQRLQNLKDKLAISITLSYSGNCHDILPGVLKLMRDDALW